MHRFARKNIDCQQYRYRNMPGDHFSDQQKEASQNQRCRSNFAQTASGIADEHIQHIG
jgi:hypothetical protein